MYIWLGRPFVSYLSLFMASRASLSLSCGRRIGQFFVLCLRFLWSVVFVDNLCPLFLFFLPFIRGGW